MLFDLRSRGRRRTVQVIYLGLAFLMLGGLVLFGVGAGNGFGGLLNAFTNNGNGSNGSSLNTGPEKAALKAVKADPSSATAWANLIQAQYSLASQGNNYNSTTGVYSVTGKKYLAQVAQSWASYQKLTTSPDQNTSIYAANAFAQLSEWTQAVGAWQAFTAAQPTAP